VAAVGDFNGWNPDAHPLEQESPGRWTVSIELPAGDYAYALEVDGVRQRDPFAALVYDDPATGEALSLARVADCAQPALETLDARATAAGALSVEAVWLRGASGARLAGASAQLSRDGAPVGAARPASVAPGAGRVELQVEGLAPGKYTALLHAWDEDGASAELRLPLWVEAAPFTWEDALIYQVVTDRFASASGPLAYDPAGIGARAGGDLAGITAAVEAGYFEALGVNAIWISPVYQNPEGLWPGSDGHDYEGYHGYWPIHPSNVEPRIGGEAALRALVAAAHARGVRVILDVVPNHVHQEHPYAGRADWLNPNPDCICGDYSCPWSSAIETCWFTPYLPDLNWHHPDVASAVVEDTATWATRFDLDGLRVDAVPMLPRAAVRELIWGLSARLEQGPTRFYTLGETFTGAGQVDDIRENLGPFGLDGQFDFPVMWAIRDLVAWRSGDAPALADAIEASLAAWSGSGSVMAPFVGNHDLSRFISEAAGDDLSDPWGRPPPSPADPLPYRQLVMAQAIALTLPGAPVLYYGDEIGLPGANDPDCRRPMRFGDQLSADESWTLERVTRLGQARACSAALRRGGWRLLYASGALLAYARDAGDGAPAVVVVNASDEDAVVDLELPAAMAITTERFVDALEGAATVSLSAERANPVTAPAWTARVYVAEGCAG